MTDEELNDEGTEEILIEQPEPGGKAAVREQLGQIKEFVEGLSVQDLRNGDWFTGLLAMSLDRYTQEVDANYFRRKYPNLPPDAIVQARIDLASRYAGIEGGLTSAAYTGAVAATIGTAGGASPLTVTGAWRALRLTSPPTSQLQLRLAHDIAVLYGVPLDLNDSEDLWKLIRIAFGIKAGEVGTGAALKAVPAVVRPNVKKIFAGSTLHAMKALPVVGKYLLLRNLVKFAIPAVGVPLTIATNYWLTRVAGDTARESFHKEARIVEAARRITQSTTSHSGVLAAMWMAIQADAVAGEEERLLLHHVQREVSIVTPDLPVLTDLRTVIDSEESVVWKMASDDVLDEHVLAAACTAAAVDGEVSALERAVLESIATRCGVTVSQDKLDRLAADLRRKSTKPAKPPKAAKSDESTRLSRMTQRFKKRPPSSS